MLLKKLQIKLKRNHGARGRQELDVLMDIIRENWEVIQDNYTGLEESDQDDLHDHFDSY